MLKKFQQIAIIVLLALSTSMVNASDFTLNREIDGNKWSTKDSLWETAYLITHIADWGQTRDIASQCNEGGYYEMNPVIGRCPSMSRVNLYFVSTALLHAGVSTLLPKKYRRFFQTSTMVMELGYITNNYNIGLKVNF